MCLLAWYPQIGYNMELPTIWAYQLECITFVWKQIYSLRRMTKENH